jgi:hypothetical protein
MTTLIEKDALKGAFSLDDAAQFTHDHRHEIKSFIATPRHDPTLMERFRSLFKSELKPGQYITKGADGLRYMFLITSNSYEDRDDETITSKALEHYEASCYPGEDLFHCDNPLLFWHDDDVPMGEIIAVNYSEPFLVEVAKELPSPTARVLWDYAERNGDKAGVSQRFGYRDDDRKPDGSYTQIFKQETSYLPERSLAANTLTAIGVIDKNMSTQQSDAWLNKIFSEATGGKIQEAAAKIHAKSGELDKLLVGLGINHKAKADVPPEGEPKVDADGNPIEDKPVEEKDDAVDLSAVRGYLGKIDRILALIDELVSAQSGMLGDMEAGMDATAALAKAVKAFEDKLETKEKANSDFEQRIALLEARLKMTPKSVQRDAPATDIEKLTQDLTAARKKAETSELVDSPVGKIKPPIKYT